MKIQYFPETDSLGIIFSDKPGMDSYEVADGITIDVDNDNRPVGIEFEMVKGRIDLSDIILKVPTTHISYDSVKMK
jgi:uncharacterized protein YuzE